MGPNVRLISRLDIKNSNVVKGIHLEGLRVVGKPEYLATKYYEAGADELVYMDAVASLYGRNSLLDIVERTSKTIFIPLTVGGGLRTLEDIRQVLSVGADKVALNTAAIRRPNLIREAAQKFGSSTIIVSIEAIRRSDGTYEAYTDNGREKTGMDAIRWAQQAVELGAGELLVTSINREGTGEGFDLELTRRIAGAVSIPVIASGGAGRLQHIVDAFVDGQAQAVCLASMLHYRHVRKGTSQGQFDSEINTNHLSQGTGFSKVQDTTIEEVKSGLLRKNIACRVQSAVKADQRCEALLR